MRIGTYVDTLELENEALRLQVKTLKNERRALQDEVKKRDDEIARQMEAQLEATNPNPFY